MEKTEVNNGFKTSAPIESGSIKNKSISPGKIQNYTNAQDNLPKRSVCGINKPLIPLKLTLFLWFGGIGIGSLIGGVVWSKYGGRFAFRLMAMICVGTSALYAFYIFSRRRNWKKELNLEKKDNVISGAQELPERFIPHLVM